MAIVYHSAYGHTRRVAQAVQAGASAFIDVRTIDILVMSDEDWAYIDHANLIVFGSAVYMGSVTAAFKVFMDSTSKRWVGRIWEGKFAAGFANSGGLSGDKLAVLQQINLFAMQHGMNWVGMPLMPTGSSEQDLNRLSGFLGLMTQSIDAPVDQTPCVGDIATANWFGEHLAKTVLRFVR